jgi:hypothetical protein
MVFDDDKTVRRDIRDGRRAGVYVCLSAEFQRDLSGHPSAWKTSNHRGAVRNGQDDMHQEDSTLLKTSRQRFPGEQRHHQVIRTNIE